MSDFQLLDLVLRFAESMLKVLKFKQKNNRPLTVKHSYLES